MRHAIQPTVRVNATPLPNPASIPGFLRLTDRED